MILCSCVSWYKVEERKRRAERMREQYQRELAEQR